MAKLTPRDIQEKEFSSGFRGYKEEAVDEFLDRVTSSYEEIFKENIDIKEEVERLTEENKKYELIGERMQAALVAAQETADDVRKNATKEAENILREAEIKAHKMVQESRDQHRELQKSLAIVKQIEEEFRFKMKSTLQSYLKLLEEVAFGDTKDVKKWILPEDMVALGERRREMEEQASQAKVIPTAKKEEAPVSVEAAEDKQNAEEAAKKPEDTAPGLAPTSVEPAKTLTVKTEERIEGPPTKRVEESDQAVARKEEPAQASKKEETAQVKGAEKPDVMPTKKTEETPAKAAKEPEQAAKEVTIEDSKAKAAGMTEQNKSETPGAKIPLGQEAGQASAVSAEWKKLQKVADEAVKGTETSTKAEKEAKAAESTMPGEMVEQKQEKLSQPENVKTSEAEPKAKDEAKENKIGKSPLEDIGIVEDESFWKDI